MNYFEHHIGDFLKDAGHLSLMEEGVYRRLIDAYYTRERALPADPKECCKLARATSKTEREAVLYVLREFFVMDDDGHHQKRCDEEIARFKDKQAKAKRSAEARWNNHETHSEGNANACANASPNAMRKHSEGNATRARPQSPVTKQEQRSNSLGQQAARQTAERFPEFWTVYPVKKGRADAERQWRAKGYDAIADRIIADVKRRLAEDRQWRDGFIPHGSTYVNARGWEDEIEPARNSNLHGDATTPDYLVGAL